MAEPAPRVISRQWHLGQTIEVVSFEQEGLPILGARGAFVRDGRGRIVRSLLELPSGDPIAFHPRPSPQQVAQWLSAKGFRMEGAPRAAWLSTDSGLRPAVRVETPWDEALPLALVLDAHTGVVLWAEPLLEWNAPLANVFPENPATTPQLQEEELQYLDENSLLLQGAYARVSTCLDREDCTETLTLAQRATQHDDLLYEPDLRPFSYDDPFAEVSAYRNLSNINAFMRERFGWQGHFFGQTYIEARVGKGDWYNAAYYRGSEDRPPRIFFGQERIDFAYDADTAAHEFGHAFNDTLWDHPFVRRDEFGLDLAPNGVEEALCDFWAIARSGDPILDAYVLRARHADNTVTCPDGEMSEGHMTAVFIDGALWSASKRIGLQGLTHVLYRSLALLPLTPSLEEFVDTLCDSANELVAEGAVDIPANTADILREEASKRGMLDEACAKRLVPLSAGAANRRIAYGYGRKTFGGRDTPFGLQWTVSAEAHRPAIKLFFDWVYPKEVEPGFAVMLRRGKPVRIEWIPADELTDNGPAYSATADLILENSPSEVDFPPVNEPPLQEGEVVYVQLAARADENTIAVTVILQHTREQAPFPTRAPPPSEPFPEPFVASARGGCSAAPPQPRLSPWLVLFATGI
jgi:hypothetical protein